MHRRATTVVMMYNVLEKLCAHGSGHPTLKPKLKIRELNPLGLLRMIHHSKTLIMKPEQYLISRTRLVYTTTFRNGL